MRFWKDMAGRLERDLWDDLLEVGPWCDPARARRVIDEIPRDRAVLPEVSVFLALGREGPG